MRKLLQTLYVLSNEYFLSLENKNVVVSVKDSQDQIAKFPLISLESIVSFSQKGATVPLMHACAEQGIQLCFMSVYGRFLCRVVNAERGNVELRREQYRMADKPEFCSKIAAKMLEAKVHNARLVLERGRRDQQSNEAAKRLEKAAMKSHECIARMGSSSQVDELRGIEGAASAAYFQVWDDLITQQKSDFQFTARSKRPPLDPVNAMLSFAYTLLSEECKSALESVGLDSCVGYLHQERSGRCSLALDLMEEFRAIIADRFVLSLINRQEIRAEHFQKPLENGAVYLSDEGRSIFLNAWNQKKRETLKHPYLKESIPKGLLPYSQAQLLAKTIRGELPSYPAFTWR